MWKPLSLALSLPLWLVAAPAPAPAGEILFPAPSGQAPREMVIYSSLDERLAAPLVAAFQGTNPTVAVRYHDLLSGDIAARVVAETDAGLPTADFVLSSAMDLQMKLANDGYAAPVDLPAAEGWPRWANWRDTAFALTFEPAVMVYHRPSFPDGPPDTRLRLKDWLDLPEARDRVGTYDIERSAVGYLFLSRDQEHFPDIWSLVAAMGRAGLQLFSTSQAIIDRVADGRLAIGYNILGSYAYSAQKAGAPIGIVIPHDYVLALSRGVMIPARARQPELAKRFLDYLLSQRGQRVVQQEAFFFGLNGSVPEGVEAPPGGLTSGMLRPIVIGPGLLPTQDRAKRERFLREWQNALQGAEPRGLQ